MACRRSPSVSSLPGLFRGGQRHAGQLPTKNGRARVSGKSCLCALAPHARPRRNPTRRLLTLARVGWLSAYPVGGRKSTYFFLDGGGGHAYAYANSNAKRLRVFTPWS